MAKIKTLEDYKEENTRLRASLRYTEDALTWANDRVAEGLFSLGNAFSDIRIIKLGAEQQVGRKQWEVDYEKRYTKKLEWKLATWIWRVVVDTETYTEISGISPAGHLYCINNYPVQWQAIVRGDDVGYIGEGRTSSHAVAICKKWEKDYYHAV